MFSQKCPSRFVYLVLILVLMLLAACNLLPTGTVEEESPCDAQDGPCLAVSFDGTNCTIVGPTDTHAGQLTVIFSNQLEVPAKVEVARLLNDKTIQDLEEDTAARPTGSAPPWVTPLGFWGTVVGAGDTATFQADTTPGDYGALCFKVPQYAIFGGGFSISE